MSSDTRRRRKLARRLGGVPGYLRQPRDGVYYSESMKERKGKWNERRAGEVGSVRIYIVSSSSHGSSRAVGFQLSTLFLENADMPRFLTVLRLKRR